MKSLIFKFCLLFVALGHSNSLIAGDTIYSLPKVAFIQYASGFSKPTDRANAGDGRLFIVEANGNIKIINANGTTESYCFVKVPEV
ncbi:MAG: hypothetical protein IPF63_11475 [Bacteroidetes bacterium]|nr:hypothetical protein [Bacteroidota bacterium]